MYHSNVARYCLSGEVLWWSIARLFQNGAIKKCLERLKEIDGGQDGDYFFIMRDYLIAHGMIYDETIDKKVSARKKGKQYGFSEHLQAMINFLLNAQRPWADVVPHLKKIDDIFFGYDTDKVLAHLYTYFVKSIRTIKCGNRNINDQMKYLPDNIDTLRLIE